MAQGDLSLTCLSTVSHLAPILFLTSVTLSAFCPLSKQQHALSFLLHSMLCLLSGTVPLFFLYVVLSLLIFSKMAIF
jgi:hypothetical protein